MWTNNGTVGGGDYDFISIDRNGMSIVVLDGDAEQYLDENPPLGPSAWAVVGQASGDTSPAALCINNVVDPNADDLVIQLSATSTGATDSAAAIAQGLSDNQLSNLLMEVDELTDLAGMGVSLGDYQRVWVELGNNPHTHMMDIAEGQLLADYVDAGGRLFIGAGDAFCFDPEVPITSAAYTGIGNCRLDAATLATRVVRTRLAPG